MEAEAVLQPASGFILMRTLAIERGNGSSHSVEKTRFGRVCGPVVRQTAECKNQQ